MTAPPAPTDLRAMTISPTQVNFTWKDSTVKGDTNDEDGFKIEYSTNPNFSPFDTVVAGANTGSKWITGLQASTPYHFRIRATNLTGGDSGISATGTATATTPAATPNRRWVTNYGAVPNDGEDDRAGIMEAIRQSLPNEIIYFPPGTYTIKGGITTGEDRIIAKGKAESTWERRSSRRTRTALPPGPTQRSLKRTRQTPLRRTTRPS